MKTKFENKYIPKPANANQDPVEIRERAVSDANEKWLASETISAWLGRLTKDERAMPIGQLAEYEKRALLNYIQHKFFDFDGDFKRLGKGVELLVMEKRPHGTDVDIFQVGPGEVFLNFFGRVVDLAAAKTINNKNLLSLGECHGITLFLDGSRHSNCEKTTCCPAWLVQQTSRKSEEPVPEKGEPKAKRPRQDATKLVVTHRLIYDEITFNYLGHDWEFKAPILAPTKVEVDAKNQLRRQIIEWDEDVLQKLKRDTKPIKSQRSFGFL